MFLPQLTYHPINWADGMKLTREHLSGNDQAQRDALRDMAGIFLNDFNYGLLPASAGIGSSVQLSFDGSELILSACRAITPGGVRIELHSGFMQPIRLGITSLQSEMTSGRHKAFFVLAVANPFERVPVGNPNPDEVPLRMPFTAPECRLAVATAEQLQQNPAGLYHVPVGKLTIENGIITLSSVYIPPCVCLGSHPHLIEFYRRNGGRMGEVVNHAMAIVNKVKTNHRPGQVNQLSVDIGEIAEKIVTFIGDTLDSYRLIVNQMPPIYAVEYFVRFSRVMLTTLRCMPEQQKEAVYNYFKNWCGISPVQMEAHISEVMEIEYQHADIATSLESVNKYMDFLAGLFSKLSQLNYVEREKDEFFIPREEPAQKGKGGFWGF